MPGATEIAGEPTPDAGRDVLHARAPASWELGDRRLPFCSSDRDSADISECLAQVVPQVFDVFDSDAESEQAGG